MRSPSRRWRTCWCCQKSGKPSVRRTRKANQRRAPAQGNRADRRGPFCRSRPGEGLRRAQHQPAHAQALEEGFGGYGVGEDRRKGSPCQVSHRLSEEERQRILLTCNQPEYASLPQGQIVPALADQGLFISSESSFYRVLHQAGIHRRGRARLPREPRSMPHLSAEALTAFGAETSASYQPRCMVCGYRSIWWSTCGATKWWPRIWQRTSRLRSRLIWLNELD